MMKLIFLSVIVGLFATAVFAQMPAIEPGVSQELAKWRSARYSDVRYKLNLTLEKMSPVLKGTIEVRVKVSEPRAVATGATPIILDWRKIRGHEEKSTISNVVVNGKAVKNPVATAPGSDSEHLVFGDGDGVVAGENVIKLDFTSPILTSGSAITRYIDKEDGSEYLYSLFVPSDASTAFPVFDQPDIKAKFSVVISTPNDWRIVCNGRGGVVTGWAQKSEWEFEETKSISTYVFAFAAGPWEKVDVSMSVPPALAGGKQSDVKPPSLTAASQPPANAGGTDLSERSTPSGSSPTPNGSLYVRKSQAEKFKPHAAEVFRLNRESVKFFEQYFDYKFPFPKYDLVF